MKSLSSSCSVWTLTTSLLEQEGGSFRLDGSKTVQRQYLKLVGPFLKPKDYEPVESGSELTWENRFRFTLQFTKKDGRVKYHGHGQHEIAKTGRAYLREQTQKGPEAVSGTEVLTRYLHLDGKTLKCEELDRDLDDGSVLTRITDSRGTVEFISGVGGSRTTLPDSDQFCYVLRSLISEMCRRRRAGRLRS